MKISIHAVRNIITYQLKFLKFTFLRNFKSIRKRLRSVLAQAWIRNVTRLMKIEGSKVYVKLETGMITLPDHISGTNFSAFSYSFPVFKIRQCTRLLTFDNTLRVF